MNRQTGIHVFWVQDSGGLTSCHRNGSNLTMKESYVGHIIMRSGSWHAVYSDGTEEGPMQSMKHARHAVQNFVDGYVLL